MDTELISCDSADLDLSAGGGEFKIRFHGEIAEMKVTAGGVDRHTFRQIKVGKRDPAAGGVACNETGRRSSAFKQDVTTGRICISALQDARSRLAADKKEEASEYLPGGGKSK